MLYISQIHLLLLLLCQYYILSLLYNMKHFSLIQNISLTTL